MYRLANENDKFLFLFGNFYYSDNVIGFMSAQIDYKKWSPFLSNEN